MASVLLSNVFVYDKYMAYTSVDSPEKTALIQSGIVTRNAMLDGFAGGTGHVVHMPFWKDLDDSVEPNYATDNPADVAVPDNVTTGEMQARRAFLDKGYSSSNLVAELAGSDPLQHIRNRFDTWWNRQFQHRLIATLQGLYAANKAGNGDMIASVASEDGLNATSANTFSRTVFLNALFTMGDRYDDVTGIAVHSTVFHNMLTAQLIQYLQPANISTKLPFFDDKLIVVDDSLPVVAGTTSGYKFVSYLFGSGVIGYGEADAPVPVEMYRRPDQGNGWGIDQLWERRQWVMQPLGYTNTGAVVSGGVSGSQTLSDLSNATNWTRMIDRKLIPLTFLVTNG